MVALGLKAIDFANSLVSRSSAGDPRSYDRNCLCEWSGLDPPESQSGGHQLVNWDRPDWPGGFQFDRHQDVFRYGHQNNVGSLKPQRNSSPCSSKFWRTGGLFARRRRSHLGKHGGQGEPGDWRCRPPPSATSTPEQGLYHDWTEDQMNRSGHRWIRDHFSSKTEFR